MASDGGAPARRQPSTSVLGSGASSCGADQQQQQRPGGWLGWLQGRWRHGLARPAAASAAAGAPSAAPRSTASPTHLVLLVNGLFGGPSNWDVICEQLRAALPPDTLLHASQVNARFATYQGIDACGARLADEVRALAAATPSLARVSVVAHSMGGLMARYALGALYNPATGTLCGLAPAHFVSMATPHCGCDADGVAQVPFIGWSGNLPLLGQQLYRFLADISGTTAGLIFQRTGRQFFLLDGQQQQQQQPAAAATAASAARAASAGAGEASSGAAASGGGGDGSGGREPSTAHLPLLLQLSQDCPDRGLYFYSALAAFRTRTAYANMDGDHLVGFANSSLRSLQQLPPPPPAAKTAKGVVLEDGLPAAFWPQHWQRLQARWAAGAAPHQPVAAVVQQPYQPSRSYSSAAAGQQQGAQRLPPAGSATGAGSSRGWHELQASSGRAAAAGAGQGQALQHPGSAVGVLELQAAGAAGAATAAVAGMMALQQQGGQAAQQEQQRQLAGVGAGLGAATGSGDDLVALSSLQQGRQQQLQQQGGSCASAARADAASAAAAAAAEVDLASGLSGAGAATAPSAQVAAADVAADAARLQAAAASAGAPLPTGASARAEIVSHVLQRLQELPWRRIDVSFQGAKFGFAHNNIQVTRRWWNFEGVAVPAHLAQQLQLMDALLSLEDDASPP